MKLVVQKTTSLQGTLFAPSSKSQSLRAIFVALLAQGSSSLSNILNSEDTQDAIRVCQTVGAEVDVLNNILQIKSTSLPLQPKSLSIKTGNSGIATRFILPLLGLRNNPEQILTVDCGDQMRDRPIQELVDALIVLGLSIVFLEKDGYLPIAISGTLRGGRCEVAGMSSQTVSALLLALPCAEGTSEIIVTDLNARPYVEMTLKWLRNQNIIYNHKREENRDIFTLEGNQTYKPFQAAISGDFSSSANLITAAVLTNSCIELHGLDMAEKQGDKKLITLLKEMGADIVVEPERIIVKGGNALTGIKIDANEIPDLVPTLAVIGTYAAGKTEIQNVRQARVKETDRIHSMTQGLLQMKANVKEFPDGMTIFQSKLEGASVNGFGDHRTVMALSIAGLLAEGETIVSDANAINKTFPTFIEAMQSMGARIGLIT